MYKRLKEMLERHAADAYVELVMAFEEVRLAGKQVVRSVLGRDDETDDSIGPYQKPEGIEGRLDSGLEDTREIDAYHAGQMLLRDL